MTRERVEGAAVVGDIVHYEDIANQNREARRVIAPADEWGNFKLVGVESGEETTSDCRQYGWTFMVKRTRATKRNMIEAAERGKQCFAFSPVTMEQSSATPGDYFGLGEDDALQDAQGNVMILAVKVTRYLDALTGEDVIA